MSKKDFWDGYVPEPDKRQQALDKMADNARELGLDYEPAQQEPVAWAWRAFDPDDGHFGKWGAWHISDYKPPRQQSRWFQVVLLPDTTPPAQEFVCSTGLCHYKAKSDERLMEMPKQEPVGEVVVESMRVPGSDAMQVRIHFYKEIPPVGSKVYTTPPAAPVQKGN